MSDTAALLESQNFQFFVSCSSIWITAVKFGVGNVLGECEPGQVRLESEEMLPRMGETQSSQCWIQVTRKCNWEIIIPPIFSHLLELMAEIKVEDKSRGYRRAELGKCCFLWINKNTQPEREEECWSLWGGNPGGGGRMRRSCRVWISESSSAPVPAHGWEDTQSRRSCPGSWQANKSPFFQLSSQVRWVIWHSAHSS